MDHGRSWDYVRLSPGGPDRGGAYVLGGALWERLEESPLDLAALVDAAAALGGGGVVLIGHSAGAPKVVHYQAQRQDPRVVGLVAMESGALDAAPAPDAAREARALAAAGHGEELLPSPAA